MDEDDLAFKEKQRAGTADPCLTLFFPESSKEAEFFFIELDAKANKEMAEKAKGKGPLNAGQQGIKKSGKK